MSTHNIGFYKDLTKIIFELSPNIINRHLISSEYFNNIFGSVERTTTCFNKALSLIILSQCYTCSRVRFPADLHVVVIIPMSSCF